MSIIPTFYIDRPEAANALDLKTAEKLKKDLDLAVKSKNLGFIITSRSPKNFCSGGDLKTYQKMKSKKEGVEVNRKIRKILEEFKLKPLLIISAIEGNAIGGGCELALATDFIFSSQQAQFAFRQVNQGLTPGWGGAKNLLDRVSPSVALDWLSSGRWVSAQEGFRVGFIDQVTTSGQVLDLAEKFLLARTGKFMDQDLLRSIKKIVAGGGKGDGNNEAKIFDQLWWGKTHNKAKLT